MQWRRTRKTSRWGEYAASGLLWQTSALIYINAYGCGSVRLRPLRGLPAELLPSGMAAAWCFNLREERVAGVGGNRNASCGGCDNEACRQSGRDGDVCRLRGVIAGEQGNVKPLAGAGTEFGDGNEFGEVVELMRVPERGVEVPRITDFESDTGGIGRRRNLYAAIGNGFIGDAFEDVAADGAADEGFSEDEVLWVCEVREVV